MTIWVDLDNAPHVPLFCPLIRKFESDGHRILTTVRDFGFTRDLAGAAGLEVNVIGRHPGGNLVRKVLGLISRTFFLTGWAAGKQIDVAVSHGSRALVLAAAMLRIPAVTMFDYEHVSTGLFHRFSRLLLPEALDSHRFGSAVERRSFPGLKEEIYLGSFEPDPDFTNRLDLPPDRVVVILRPPATMAHYHSRDSETIFQAILDAISVRSDTMGVIVPRTRVQAGEIRLKLKNPLNFIILDKPVNGLDLIWQADLVISGGGTMNREAALLGVPVYSVFGGTQGVIDRDLVGKDKLKSIGSVAEVEEISFQKRSRIGGNEVIPTLAKRSEMLISRITQEILDLAG